jgi:predicted nucleic-acid-binding protein
MNRIDANVILRYLLDDHEELSSKSVAIIDYEPVHVSVEVICEVVYVLSGVYEVTREELGSLLLSFFDLPNVSVDDLAILKVALPVFAEKKIDFVDALLYSHHVVQGDRVITFDKRLAKMMK